MLSHDISLFVALWTASTHVSPKLVELVELSHVFVVFFDPVGLGVIFLLLLILHLLHEIVLVF